MDDNNNLQKQAKPQEFELVELLFREYSSSHTARPDIEYSFQVRFQSYINQISSYLHSSTKTGFFTHFFFGVFTSLLDTKLTNKLNLKKLKFNFDKINHLRIVAETNDKTHVFIFTENNLNKNYNNNKDIVFTKDEWRILKGKEYTDNDNKKLEISVIQINKSTGNINVMVEKKDIQDDVGVIKQYYEITRQYVDKKRQHIVLEDKISKLSTDKVNEAASALRLILEYIKRIHDHYHEIPYGDKAREANDHGFIAGVFNNFRYRENAHTYIEQLAGKGYADIILLVQGADRSTKSIPIIIELKAGTGNGTTSGDALKHAKEYTKGFQPNNMRMLSFADHILCVGMNLDLPTDSFVGMEAQTRDSEVIPLIQAILDDLSKGRNNLESDIRSKLENTYKAFPGIQQMSANRYMSRYILGESIELKGYNKFIFLYDEVYLPTKTVINTHATRSRTNDQHNHPQPGKGESNKRKVVDDSSSSGSKKLRLDNAINTILFIPNDRSKHAILLNIIEAYRDVPARKVKLDLKQTDPKLFEEMRIVQLDIQFNIGKSKESFDEYCNIKLLKSYGSVTEYNVGSEQIIDGFHTVDAIVSDYLMHALNEAVTAQSDPSQAESECKQLFQKIGEEIYPIKSLIEKEAEFQALLEGIFKYYSDIKLGENSRKSALVLVITEFQTGAGKRIDILVQAIGRSVHGTKEYTPVGIELKYDNTIELSTRDQKKDEKAQKVKLEHNEQKALKGLLSDQPEMYAAGAAIKSITDAKDVAIIGVVFNQKAKDPCKLFLASDFVAGKIEHSSIWITQLMDYIDFTPEWLYEDEIDAIKRVSGDDLILLSLTAKGLDDNALKQLGTQWIKNKNLLQSIDSLDLSYNFLSVTAIKEFILSTKLNEKLIYLDISSNSFKFTDNSSTEELNALKEIIQKVREGIKLKISDIEMSSAKACEIIKFLSQNDKVSHLEMQDLVMSSDIAYNIADYIEHSKKLTLLDLSYCKVNDDHAKIIISKLSKQDKLEKLILVDNKISAIGAKYFETVLPSSAIYHLDLSNNPLTMDGFRHIVNAISPLSTQSSNVEIIKLSCVGIELSQIKPEDISFFERLFQNTKLQNIDISYNNNR